LLNHVEHMVDIEIRKNMTIVYPKNYRFGPQTLMNRIIPTHNEQLASAFQYNFYQQNEPAELSTPPGLMKMSSRTYSNGMGNQYTISPILFYGQDEDEEHHETVSNLNTACHSRAQSKVSPVVDDSNIEIERNLKFIEELLEDNGNELQLSGLSLDKSRSQCSHSKNMSFGGISMIQSQSSIFKASHMKTQSEDLSWKNEWRFQLNARSAFSQKTKSD